MTPVVAPCYVCGAAAQLPESDGLCLTCRDFTRRWKPQAIRNRGDHAEPWRSFGRSAPEAEPNTEQPAEQGGVRSSRATQDDGRRDTA